jgi:hypothetical protein
MVGTIAARPTNSNALIVASICATNSKHWDISAIWVTTSHKQVLREKGRPDLVLAVGLLSIQTKSDGDGTPA